MAVKPLPEKGAQSILINFVLDKSGSMETLMDATISGFNEFKNDQAREDGKAFFTLTLFDTEFHTPVKATPIAHVADLTRGSYRPGGMTALYDAIGHTLRITDDFVAEHHPEQVLFVIMTDGYENASREYDQHSIFELIRDRQENADYEFIYLGANQDSYAAGQAMGVRDGRMMDYAATPAAVQETMLRASRNVTAHRRVGVAQSAEFFTREMEELGGLNPLVWDGMTEEEREEFRERAAASKATRAPRQASKR